MAKLKEAQYSSGAPPKSQIFKTSFAGRLSSLFGWKGVQKQNAQTEFEKQNGLRFVKVDIGNDQFRTKHAALGSVFKSAPLATSLNKYFNAYINETTLVYSDIAERQQRLNELKFMVLNDPFIGRCCQLVADEATQLDDQNRLLSVESPSIAFVNRCYELFSMWGLTQSRISAVCYDLEQYGEALWGHRISAKGVERIIPLKVPMLQERLEFSPVHMAEVVAQMAGGLDVSKNRASKISKLMNLVASDQGLKQTSDLDENFADMFDTKLLGYEFHDNIIVPPWLISHFRFNADNSEFFPYGRPPLLHALAPFKQFYSTMALQGLARAASFPVQVYSVKGTEGVSVATAFETVNSVREDYENIGVSPSSNSLEVYTVNTKIWVPEGLLDMKVHESKVDMDFIGDLEMFQDRIADAIGIPKGYLSQEFGGFGQSGIALTEQYKPFARHVYGIQSSFLDGLGSLLRLHFAITGEFDYNMPFVLSMRFPAEDMGEEKRNARQASVELANGIIEMLQGVLAMEEGEPLPEDVVADILSKYTFLDPTDLQRWIRLSAIAKAAAAAATDDEGDGGGEDDGSGFEMDGDMEGGGEGDIAAGDDSGGDPMPESMALEYRNYYMRTKKLLREKLASERKSAAKALREKEIRRLKEVSMRYRECKQDIYFNWLREQNLTEWVRPGVAHEMLVPRIDENHTLFNSIRVLTDKGNDNPVTNKRLQERTLQDQLNETKGFNDDTLNTMMGQQLREEDELPFDIEGT